MSMDIIVKKGLDLKLIGKPSNEIEQAKFSQDFAVYPADFHGVFPKLVVKENVYIEYLYTINFRTSFSAMYRY